MSFPEGTGESVSRWLWLDRWFAPRWRALLTWMVLTGLMGWALEQGAQEYANGTLDPLYINLNQWLPVSIHRIFQDFSILMNAFCLLCWFEPLALRLKLLCGFAWLALRVIPISVVIIVFNPTTFGSFVPLTFTGCSALGMFVLRGQRTRPWMAMIAGALTASAFYVRENFFWNISEFGISNRPWFWITAVTLPYAAVLLYGTRLLRPEEHHE